MGDALACTRRSITSACPPCNGHAGERSVSPEKEAGPPDGGSTRLRVSRSAPRHRTRQRGRAACQAAGAQPRGAVPAPRSGWAASPRSSGWRQTRWRRPRGAAAPPHSPPPALPATARFAARKKDPARHCPQIAPRAPARPPRAQGASTAPPAARHRQAAHRRRRDLLGGSECTVGTRVGAKVGRGGWVGGGGIASCLPVSLRRPRAARGDALPQTGRERPRRALRAVLPRTHPPPQRRAPRTKWTRRVPHPVLIGHAAGTYTACQSMRQCTPDHCTIEMVHLTIDIPVGPRGLASERCTIHSTREFVASPARAARTSRRRYTVSQCTPCPLAPLISAPNPLK